LVALKAAQDLVDVIDDKTATNNDKALDVLQSFVKNPIFP